MILFLICVFSFLPPTYLGASDFSVRQELTDLLHGADYYTANSLNSLAKANLNLLEEIISSTQDPYVRMTGTNLLHKFSYDGLVSPERFFKVCLTTIKNLEHNSILDSPSPELPFFQGHVANYGLFYPDAMNNNNFLPKFALFKICLRQMTDLGLIETAGFSELNSLAASLTSALETSEPREKVLLLLNDLNTQVGVKITKPTNSASAKSILTRILQNLLLTLQSK